MKVYNYLASEWALSNIALKRIRVSRLADLNDPFELLAAYVANNKRLRISLSRRKRELHKAEGLLCFSKDWHNSVMWSHYAAKHQGMCLGFEVPDTLVRKVTYSDNRIRNNVKEGDSIHPTIDETLRYVKYSHWSYEEEVRQYVPLASAQKEGSSYFLPFSDSLILRQVFVGPRCDVDVARIRALIDSTYDKVHVNKTRLAYRTFRVTDDKAFGAMHKSISRRNAKVG